MAACPLIVGHRANTLRWLRRYLREGVDGVEVDAVLVGGEPRLGHPARRRRSPLLRERIAQILEGLHILKPMGIRDLVELVPEDIILWVDVKGRGAPELVSKILTLTRRHSIIVSTRYHDEASQLASMGKDKQIIVMLSMESRPHSLEAIAGSSGARGIAIESSYIDEDLVREAHMLGMQVASWTVNEESELSRMIGLGVDYVITDYPGVARRLCRELASRR